MQQSCSGLYKNALCRDTKFVEPSSLYTSAYGNYRDIIFFVATSIFLFSLFTLLQ